MRLPRSTLPYSVASPAVALIHGSCSCCKCLNGPVLVVSAATQPPLLNPAVGSATTKNIGSRDADPFLICLELNQARAPIAAKSESRFTVSVPGLPAGISFVIPGTAFTVFSSRLSSNLNILSSGELMITADVKNMDAEINEPNYVLIHHS